MLFINMGWAYINRKLLYAEIIFTVTKYFNESSSKYNILLYQSMIN